MDVYSHMEVPSQVAALDALPAFSVVPGEEANRKGGSAG
jgi:hypothetical protein